MTARKKTEFVAEAVFAKKGENVVVLDMRGVTGWTDYFVISSGSSTRQVKAIADEVAVRLNHGKTRSKSIVVEGYAEGEWVLIDAGDVIVHIFLDERRDFYDLEGLWGDAPRIKVCGPAKN